MPDAKASSTQRALYWGHFSSLRFGSVWFGLGWVGLGFGYGIGTLDWHMSNELFVSQHSVSVGVLAVNLCEIVFFFSPSLLSSSFFFLSSSFLQLLLPTHTHSAGAACMSSLERRVFYYSCRGFSIPIFIFPLYPTFFAYFLTAVVAEECE